MRKYEYQEIIIIFYQETTLKPSIKHILDMVLLLLESPSKSLYVSTNETYIRWLILLLHGIPNMLGGYFVEGGFHDFRTMIMYLSSFDPILSWFFFNSE